MPGRLPPRGPILVRPRPPDPPPPTFIHAGILVLSPRCQAEVLQLVLRAPCDVDDALHEIADAREAEQATTYDCLLPFEPQPDRSFAVVLAIPSWAVARLYILVDTRSIDNRLFCWEVPEELSYSSLLLHVGVQLVPGLRVFVSGQRVDPGRFVQFQNGCTVTILGPNQPFIMQTTFEDMLASARHWQIPCPIFTGEVQAPFCVLTDGDCRVVPVDPDRVHSAEVFKEFVASVLQYAVFRTTICPARVPRIDNVALVGRYCRAVVVATERIVCVPIPPGRLIPKQFVVIIDRRPILQDPTWMLAEEGFICQTSFYDSFRDDAPEGYTVSIHGGTVVNTSVGPAIQVSDGTVSTVEYVAIADSGHDVHISEQDEEEHGSDDSDDSDPSGDTSSSPSTPSAGGAAPGSTGEPRARDRSRSPRQVADAPSSADQRGDKGFLSCYRPSSSLCALTGSLDYLHLFDSCSIKYLSSYPRAAKLLDEPVAGNTSADRRLSAARRSTALLGQEWPYRGREGPPDDHPIAAPIQQAVAAIAGPSLLTVAILKPDFQLEQVQVWLPHPVQLATALGTIQAARSPDMVALYSLLRPVFPQLTPCWATFVAVPFWAITEVVVCIDARQIDGRVFALCLSGATDRRMLLRAAGVDTDDADVYTPYDALPARDDVVIPLAAGICVSIVPRTATPSPFLDIEAVLLFPLAWRGGPAFPVRPLENCYCVVQEIGHQLFSFDPASARFYRERLAALVMCPLAQLHTAPSWPRIEDSACHGWPCRTVLAAANSLGGPRTPDPQLFIVDCRALLQGWYTAWTPNGVVDVQALCAELAAFASPGLEVQLFRLPRGLLSTQVENGSCLVAYYVATEGSKGIGTLGYSPNCPDRRLVEVFLVLLVCLLPFWVVTWWWLLFLASCVETDARDARDRNIVPLPIAPPHHGNNKASVYQASTHGTARYDRWFRFLAFFALLRPGEPVQVFAISGHDSPAASDSEGGVDMWNPDFTHDVHCFGPREDTPALNPHTDAACSLSDPPLAFRPIPTPCRACGLMPIHSTEWDEPFDDTIGPTLLEECLSQASCPAYLLAATLLDTLVSHFAEVPVLQQEVVPLCLDALVPLTKFQADAFELVATIPQPVAADLYWSGASLDWLDADLAAIVADTTVPAAWRHTFASLPKLSDIAATEAVQGVVIYTDGSASRAHSNDITPAAWAFTVWVQTQQRLLLVGHCAHSTVPLGTPYSLGELTDTPMTSELLALAWALVWSIEYGSGLNVPLEFRYDCTSAGGSAFGTTRAQASLHSAPGDSRGPSLRAFTGFLRQALEIRATVFHRHVKGHAGDVGNELCDRLAKAARRRPDDYFERCLPEWPHRWWCSPLASWGWLAGYNGSELPFFPALEAEAARLQRQKICPAPPHMGVSHVNTPAASVAFRFELVSFNILTMFDPHVPHGRANRLDNVGLRIAGKRDVLKKQLLERETWMIGFQETRLPTSAQLPDADFVMLNIEANSAGQYGCALWVNKHFVYAVDPGVEHKVTADQLTVAYSSERHMQVHLEAPRLKLAILVVHGPKAKHNRDPSVQAFWDARARDLARRPCGADCVILADANAHLGSIETAHVGPFGAETENWEGQCFHAFLSATECFVPSTTAVHAGQHWTWCAPGPDPICHRLDYVALPCAWAPFVSLSQVWEDVEALQARKDHLPVSLQLAFCKDTGGSQEIHFRRQACRPPVGLDFQARHAFAQELGRAPASRWEEDIDEHYQSWVGHVSTAARSLCDVDRAEPRQSYMQQSTLLLVQKRKEIRKHIRIEEKERSRRFLLISFAAFVLHTRQESFSADALSRAEGWMRAVDYSIAALVELLYETTTAVRAAVGRDRASYLAGLVTEVTRQDLRNPKALYAAVRRAFPAARSSRRSAFQPLPAVKMADGTMAITKEERETRWIEFFGDQEAGVRVDAQQYGRAFCDPDIPIRDEGLFSVAALPTLYDLEQQLLKAKYGKACGPDGLTAEVFRVAVPPVAKLLFPICLKASLGLREPVEWRGGCLYCLAKKAQAALECKSYRSILMASTAGKAHHRMLRDRLMPHFQSHRAALQYGQAAGVGVEGVAHIVRTYQVIMQHRRHTCAVTFFGCEDGLLPGDPTGSYTWQGWPLRLQAP